MYIYNQGLSIYVYLYIHILLTYISIRVNACVYIYMYICIFIYIYIYIYLYSPWTLPSLVTFSGLPTPRAPSSAARWLRRHPSKHRWPDLEDSEDSGEKDSLWWF